MRSAGLPAGPDIPDWVPPASYLDRLEARVAELHPSAGSDIWIVAGQSNAIGYGTQGVDLRIDPPFDRIEQYGVPTAPVVYQHTISQAQDPLWHGIATAPGVGPAMPFARRLLRSMPASRSVLLVGTASGGTGFRVGGNGHWKKNYPAAGTTDLYANMIAQAQAALALAGAGARFAGLLWVQGEADSGTDPAQYQADLDELIDGVRTDLAVPDLRIVLGQLVPEYMVGNAGRAAIGAVHIDTPRRKTRTAFAYGPVGYGNGDALHYTNAGSRLLGAAMADAVPRADANTLGVLPLTPAGLTATQSGTTISAAWQQVTGRATDYSMQYRQGTSGSWSTLTRAQSIDVSAVLTPITTGLTYQLRVASVNEQGTSAYSDPVTVATVVAPSQVTGLAAGTPTAATVPLSWSVAAGAVTYRVEYKRTSSGIWLTATTVAGTSATVVGLASSTSHDFRVAAVNPGGDAPVSSVVTASTVAPGYMVSDMGVTVDRAYSVCRRVVSGYAGSLIRVRRSSDNTEQNIGLDGDLLDTAALLAFVGAGNGFVVTLYDQSGSARDVTQATQAAQPLVVTSGALVTKNGLPAISFDGIAQYLTGASSGLYANGSASWIASMSSSGSGSGRLIGEDRTTASTQYKVSIASASRCMADMRNDASVQFVGDVPFGSDAVFDGSQRVLSWVDTGAVWTMWREGVQADSPVSYTRSGVVTVTNFTIGCLLRNVSFFASLTLSELIVVKAALTSTQRQNGEANARAFYATA